MAEKKYVLSKEAVKHSLQTLQQLKIHRTFAGYLCLREAARGSGRRDKLKPDFAGFFDRYLKIGDASVSMPYAVPFNDRGYALWFNRNVAGSYAPSSLRGVSPLRRVADIFGARADHTFALKDNDARLCFDYLLHKTQIPVLALAAFLFRDYAFEIAEGDALPGPTDLTTVFCEQFGFRSVESSEASDFKTLFNVQGPAIGFEELK